MFPTSEIQYKRKNNQKTVDQRCVYGFPTSEIQYKRKNNQKTQVKRMTRDNPRGLIKSDNKRLYEKSLNDNGKSRPTGMSFRKATSNIASVMYSDALAVR
jgi:hypothetical protein